MHLLLVLVVVAGGKLRNAEFDAARLRRIAVIPDLHGDSEAAVEALFLAYRFVTGEEVDHRTFVALFATFAPVEPPLYTGARTGLIVQMGDLIDKGKHSGECVGILSRAESILGIRLANLYGNHELIALLEVEYEGQVHPEDDLDRGVDFEPRKAPMWLHMYDHYFAMVRIGSSSSGRLSDPSLTGSTSGESEASDFSAPWLSANPSTLFVHAGLDLDWLLAEKFIHPQSPVNVNTINRLLQQQIGTADIEKREFDMIAERGFLFTRQLEQDPNMCELIDEILRVFAVARIVLGHTIQQSRRMSSRCGGKIIFTDVGTSRWSLGPRGDDPTLAHPAILAMSISEDGNMESIEAHYGSLVSDEIQVLPLLEKPEPIKPIKPLNGPEQTAPSLELLEIFTTNSVTTIQHARFEGADVLLQTFTDPNRVEFLEASFAQLAPHAGIPEVSVLHVNGAKVILIETPSLAARIQTVSQSTADQIRILLAHCHAYHFTLLPSVLELTGAANWIGKFFAITPDTGMVQLVNFSGLAAEHRPLKKQRELRFVQDVLERKLRPPFLPKLARIQEESDSVRKPRHRRESIF